MKTNSSNKGLRTRFTASRIYPQSRHHVDATRQFNDIIVATVDGTPVRIADVGYAEDSVQRVTSSLFADDGSPGVQLDIRRASGENTIRVTTAVKQKLTSIQQTLPKGVKLTLNTDDSRSILASIASLEEHLLWESSLRPRSSCSSSGTSAR